MNIEFERTAQDIIDFNLFHLANSASAKRQLLQSQVLTAMLVVVFALSVSYALYGRIDAVMIVVTALGAIGAFLIVPPLNRRYVRNAVTKMLKEGNNAGLLGQQSLTLSPEGIFAKNQTTESKITWLAVDKVLQDEKHIYLFTSSINALVIPKSCFKTEAEKQEFLAYIDQQLQQK